MTRDEKNKWQREHRKKTHNAEIHKYEKTVKGFLVRKYRNMESRVTGVQKKKFHLYGGLDLLPREEFYNWAFDSKEFHTLFKEWVESGYDRKLCPTVDRVDSSLGYSLDNMEWVTHSENSRRGATNKYGLSILQGGIAILRIGQR